MQQELPLVVVEVPRAPEEPAASPDIRIDIVRSPRRRTLAIHVGARGAVEVRAPLWIGAGEIAVFLERHRNWIRRKVDEAAAAPAWMPRWDAGGDWYWRGERVLLVAAPARRAGLQPGELHLPVMAGAAAADWQRAVFNWHRREAKTLLTARIRELFAQHGGTHRLKAIEFRWMRATWGTCGGRRAADGRRDVVIRLNPWLAALPPAVADAVLLHELAHIEHMNHGAAFYRRLERLDPQWREHDRELKHWARLLFPVAVAPGGA